MSVPESLSVPTGAALNLASPTAVAKLIRELHDLGRLALVCGIAFYCFRVLVEGLVEALSALAWPVLRPITLFALLGCAISWSGLTPDLLADFFVNLSIPR